MQHTRTCNEEGWRTLTRWVYVVPLLGVAFSLFEMSLTWRVAVFTLLSAITALCVLYAVWNLWAGGVFSCRLTDDAIIQQSPVSACGESFHIPLAEITAIERHDSGDEGPSDEWYIHTAVGRHRIASNYGNPAGKFAATLQERLPQVERIDT